MVLLHQPLAKPHLLYAATIARFVIQLGGYIFLNFFSVLGGRRKGPYATQQIII